MKQSWKTEILASMGALTVLLACLFLLWRDSHAADDGGRKVGSITYRFRIAQRRDGGSVLWRDVDLNSPVYNNNYVRTDAASEAVVTLNDRTRIELEPDSMIVLQVSDKRVNIRLDRGSLLLRRKKQGAKPLSITTKDGQRDITPGSGDTRVDRLGDELRAAPREGVPVPLSPPDNLRLFIKAGSVPVDFAWREKTAVTFEISPNREMRRAGIRRTVMGGALRLPLTPGFHYWRIHVSGRASVPRRIRVVRKPPLLIHTPENGRTFSYSLRPPLVGFSWSPDRLALSYTVRVARDAALRDTVTEMRAYRMGVSRAFPAGTYYWRLKTEGVLPGAESVGPIRRFVVRETKSPTRPTLIFPPAEAILSRKAIQKNGILFRWSGASDIARANLRVMAGTAKAAPKISVAVRDNHQRAGKNLTPGVYYWQIRLRGRAGVTESRTLSFRVVAGDAPARAKPEKTAKKIVKNVPASPLLARPRTIFPRNGSVVDMSARDFINFRWRAVPGAVSYVFVLYHRGRVLHKRTTRDTRLKFTDLSKLDTGRFSWLVIAKPATNSGKKASRRGASFRITLSDGPDKPSFK